MTLAITINVILSAIVFTATVGFLAAATRPSRRIITLAPAASRTPSSNRAPAAAAATPARGLA